MSNIRINALSVHDKKTIQIIGDLKNAETQIYKIEQHADSYNQLL